jgi:hypothetical protein
VPTSAVKRPFVSRPMQCSVCTHAVTIAGTAPAAVSCAVSSIKGTPNTPTGAVTLSITGSSGGGGGGGPLDSSASASLMVANSDLKPPRNAEDAPEPLLLIACSASAVCKADQLPLRSHCTGQSSSGSASNIDPRLRLHYEGPRLSVQRVSTREGQGTTFSPVGSALASLLPIHCTTSAAARQRIDVAPSYTPYQLNPTAYTVHNRTPSTRC